MVPRIYSQNKSLRLGIFFLCLFTFSFSFGQTAPSFTTCPGTAAVTLPPGGGTLTLSNANIPLELGVMAVDPDGVETITYSATPSSFTCADAGTVVAVSVIATDSDGSASCTPIMVTVQDGGPIAVCNNFTAVLDATTGAVTVNFADVGGSSSNCSGVFTTQTIDGAASQNYTCADIGTFAVTVLVADAIGSDDCMAMVTVVDNTSPTVTGCSGNLTGNTSDNGTGDCAGSVAAWNHPTVTDNCTVTTMTYTMSGATTQAATTFTSGGAGPTGPFNTGVTTVNYTISDGTNAGAPACSFTITITDDESPTVVCNNTSVTLDATGNYSLTTADLATISAGSMDNCPNPTITVTPNTFDCTQAGTMVAVTVSINDGTNAAVTCNTAMVTVNDAAAPTISNCPTNGTSTTSVGGTGDCMGDYTWTHPTVADNCTANVVQTFTLSGATSQAATAFTNGASITQALNIGTTTVTYNVSDVTNAGTPACSFTITVTDDEAPNAAAVNPGNMTVNNDTGVCQATVSWPSVTNVDNCPGTVTVAYTTTHPKLGTTNILTGIQGGVLVDFGDFPLGTTTVNYTITDNASPANTDMGTFTVTVEDNEPPSITCPSPQTLHYADCNTSAMVPDYTGLGNISDNCPFDYTVTQMPAAGTIISSIAGITPANGETFPVTITVTDNMASSSNMGTSCTFIVTLDQDNDPEPSINTAVLATANGGCGPLTIPAPTAVDACGNLICGVPFPPVATNLGPACGSNPNPCTPASRSIAPGAAIPDANATGLTSTINVTGADPVIDDVNVTINITHTWVGDLQATLTSPTGTVVQLFDRPGVPAGTFGCSSDDLSVTFDDAAANTSADFENQCFPAPNGSYQAIVPLAMFNNENPNGTWTLNITDSGGGDTGTLDDWTLDFCLKTVGTSITNYEFPVGTHNITWNFDDGNGNTSSQQQQIIVTNDIQPPTFNCQDITVQLDASGNATVVPGDVLESASITLTSGNDGSGLFGTTSFAITVPTSTTYTFDWNYSTLDPGFEGFGYILNGTQTVLAASTNTGSSSVTVNAGDVFEFAALTVDNTFGPGTVVISNFSPGFAGALGLANWNFSNTDADGTFSSAPGEASDNCTTAANLTYALSQSSFDCTNIGANSVTLTVTDMAGNPGTCSPVVTVVDNIPPVFNASTLPANMVVHCDSVPAVAVGIVANDNCGTVGMNFNQTSTQIGNSSLCADYNYTITRTWTATDASGNSSSHVQTITVIDNTAPVFTLPTSLSFSANQGSCQATVSLNISASDLSDNCAPFNDLTITNNAPIGADNVQIGNGTTDASGVYPVGSTAVTFTATDPCGKVSTHVVMVNVVDNTPPIATCKNNVAAVIPAGASQITIPYQLIDNGSFDNCAGLTYSVFPSSFSCSQADGVTAWPITLTVTENVPGGQSSSCQTTIIIQDNTNPVAMCKDITVNLDANGNASITAADIDDGSFDACSGIQSISLLSQSNFTVADVGPNTATIVVTDNNGNSHICSSTVTVAPPQTCFSVDDGIGGNGFLAGTGISEVPVNTTNFINAQGFQFTLEIDETVATFQGINNINTVLSSNGLLTVIANSTGDTLTVSWLNTSGMPITLNTAQLFTITVDVVGVVGAMTPITFINLPTPPEFTSQYGSTIFTNPNYPPCTDNGKITVDVTATLTVAGNVRTWGVTQIDTMIDNTVMPPDTTITSTVIFPVQDVANVVISKTETHPGLNGGAPLSASNAATTDAAGDYLAVVSNQPGGVDLDLNANKATPNWLNNGDVSSSDLFFIQQHIVANIPFVSIFQYVASDVNEDGLVTTLDLVLIQDVIVNPEGSPNPSSVITTYAPWRFVPATDSLHLQPLPALPNAPLINEQISFTNYTTAMTDVDWIAVKIGHVFGNLNTSLLTVAETRSGENLNLQVENQKIASGDLVSIPVYAKDFADYIAWQFTLEFDESTLEYEGLIPGAISSFKEGKLGLNAVDQGIIGALWYGKPLEVEDDEVLFTLQFNALQDSDALSGLLDISSKTVDAETSLINGATGDVKLSFFEPTTTVSSEFELHQNRPNPFNGKTVISFVLPEAGFGKVTIFDISGRVLKEVEGDFVTGYNEISIHSKDISTSGVLYYQLESAEHTATKKMIILD